MFDWLTNFGESRFVSLLIAAGYLSIGLFMPGASSIKERLGFVLAATGYLVLPLLCIWFGDEMGNFIGTLPGPAINKPTPGCLVILAGWVLLVLPAIVLLISLANQ